MNIIYICPTPKEASGGVSEIYRHISAISGIVDGVYIYHPKGKSGWLPSLPGRCIEGAFSVNQADFFIIPDIWARKYGPRIQRFGARFGILVQGGFLIDGGKDDAVLIDVYKSADLIISASESIDQFIRCAFPWTPTDRIVRVSPFVSSSFTVGEKKKIIAYMPRRNRLDSDKVSLYLSRRLPPEWKIERIDGVGLRDVAKVLGEASIFLAFSEREGFGLPPLEAHFAGCKVIGYHAQGGREYFTPPDFDVVDVGNVPLFCDVVLKRVAEMDAGLFDWSAHFDSTRALRDRYQSKEVEMKEMQNLLALAKSGAHSGYPTGGYRSIRSVLRKPLLSKW